MKKAFSLVEVLLAVSVFSLIVTVLAGALIYGQQSTALAGMRSRAVLLADEGLEAMRNTRDASFASLVDSSDVVDIFTRTITISTPSTDRRQITSTVTWQQNLQRSGEVTAVTYLTNWRAGGGGGTPTTCSAYCISLGSYTAGTCRQNSVQCTNNGETYQSGGNTQCITTFPGDPSHDTCCCL